MKLIECQKLFLRGVIKMTKKSVWRKPELHQFFKTELVDEILTANASFFISCGPVSPPPCGCVPELPPPRPPGTPPAPCHPFPPIIHGT